MVRSVLHVVGPVLCLLLVATAARGQLLPPAAVIGKELSNDRDEDSTGAPNDLRNLGWDGLGNTVDAFDYSTSGPPPLDPDQVDALANTSDYLFPEVLANRASLVLSFDMRNDIHFHETNGNTGIWATPPQVSNNPLLDDVDGLELWTGDVGVQKDGLVTPLGDFDANHYSIVGDPVTPASPPSPPGTPAVSVYLYQPLIDVSTPYILHNDLRNAVAQFLGFEPDQVTVDLDAMLLNDRVQEDPVPGGPPWTWDIGDQIIFSLWPDTLLGLDGGELFFWENGQPVQWLVHGGRVWDTANPVAQVFGVNTENINALEAVIPEPASLALLAAAAALIGARRQRARRLR